MENSTTTTASNSNHQNDTEKLTSPMSTYRILTILIVVALIVGGVAVPAFLFLYSDRGPYSNTYPLSIDMAVIIILCVLGVLIPVATGLWLRRCNAHEFNSESKTKYENNDDINSNRSTKMQRLRQSLCDGLYVELHKRPSPEL
mmetsp:Transcript_23535/g.40089  ORF Transcript_23535/g.40089 Transcript_23535/m.40089 type:complete len:144 (-) Transcript_23535:31-462(-)